jgi:DNA-binding GntR family transcriptional regulator
MTMTKVAPPSLMTDQVFTAIQQAIMSGEMPAGYRLRIRDIAAQVGTSVMPVREAFRRLEEAGLAERVPNKGTVVKGLTLEELIHVYDVRRLLEAEAARQGARAISAAETETMQRHYEQILTAVSDGDLIGALDADEAMLETLYRASGNPVLTDLIRGLWRRCRAYKIAGARRAAEESDDSHCRYTRHRSSRPHGRTTSAPPRRSPKSHCAAPAGGSRRCWKSSAHPPASRIRNPFRIKRQLPLSGDLPQRPPPSAATFGCGRHPRLKPQVPPARSPHRR